jgi:uncharacterized protein YdaU (DUF1376 family)
VTKIRRVDFSADEWIAGTRGMTLAEEGLYIRICALIYSHGGPITIDHIKRCCSEHGNKVNSLLTHLEMTWKIDRKGDEIDQKRCRNELEKALKRHETAVENGSRPKQNNGLSEAAAKPLRVRALHQLPTINHQLPKRESDARASQAKANGKEDESPLAPIPNDWQPGNAERAFAAEHGHGSAWVERNVALFVKYNRGKGTISPDWSAMWASWVLRAEDYEKPVSVEETAPADREQMKAEIQAAYDEAMAKKASA